MKKILPILSLSLLALFSSCTEEPPKHKEARVTATIDGVETVFNTINVNEITYTNADQTYTDVRVTASIDNKPDLTISFVVEKYLLGSDTSYYFAYFLNETAFPKLPGFLVEVTENNGDHLLGTFSGQVQADVEPYEIVEIENGTFDIVY